MARLILSLKGRELDKFLIGQGKVVAGRSPDCDITIDNPAISRKHTQIEFKNGDYVLTDLNSSNGTFLNGERIEVPQSLKPGDVIGVAKFELHFQEAPQAEVQEMMGGMDEMEQTVMVDAEAMASKFAQVSSAPTASGPRKLVVLKGDANIKELVLERDVITIGKADTCDLVVPGLLVSKLQATVTHKEDKHYVNPIGGSVKVNNEKISKEKVLKLGDTIIVGKTVIAFT